MARGKKGGKMGAKPTSKSSSLQLAAYKGLAKMKSGGANSPPKVAGPRIPGLAAK